MDTANRSINGPSTRGLVTKQRSVVWPAAVLLYSTLLPPEVRLEIGGLEFYAYRIVLFAVMPFVLIELTRVRLRFVFVDYLVLFSAFWTLLGMVLRYGLAEGLESGGALSFDLVSAYSVGRAYLRSPQLLARVLLLGLPGLVVTGIMLAVESLSHQLIVRPFLGSLLGTESDTAILRQEVRIGLLRAYGPFPHPILGGVQMTSFIPLFGLAVQTSARQRLGIIAATLGFFSLSSAAISGLLFNYFFLAYDWVVRALKIVTWRRFIYFSILLMAVVELGSKSGLISVIYRYFTFDAQTGFYRTLIWQFGIENVVQNPWFGLGFEDWVRPDWMHSASIDAHWLLQAMQFGLPAGLSLVLAVVWTVFKLGQRSKSIEAGQTRNSCVGVTISLTTLTLLLFTVALWGNSYAWFVMLLGCGASFSHMRLDLSTTKNVKAVIRSAPLGSMRVNPQAGGDPVKPT